MKSSYSVLLSIKSSIDNFANELPFIKVSNKLQKISEEINNIVTNDALISKKIRKINNCLSSFSKELHEKDIYMVVHKNSNFYNILKATSTLKNEMIHIYESTKNNPEINEKCREDLKSLLFICSRIYLACLNELEPIHTDIYSVDKNDSKAQYR